MDKKTIKPLSEDVRGAITVLFDIIDEEKIKSVLLISSHKGAIRANHYHKKDCHYTYLISGKFEYSEKDLQRGAIHTTAMLPGDMVKTSAGIVHAMKFLEDSVMIVFTTEDRDPVSYEKDTIRIELVK